MGTMCRTIWCATCATKLGLPFVSLRCDTGAVRWGQIHLPFLSCDCCRKRMNRHDIAAGVSTFRRPDDYRGWEEAFLYELEEDVERAHGGFR